VRVEVFVPGGAPAGDLLVIPPGLVGTPSDGALSALRDFARGGGHVLGLGGGVAWLCAAELLPGAVAEADAGAASPTTHVRVEGRATAFTWAIPAGRILPLAAPPVRAHYAAPDADVAALAARGRVILRYCDSSGGVGRAPDGAHAAAVAGLADESGRVVGLLAPTATSLDGDLGRQLLTCLRDRR
jgi:phosphoribosylformylglycinamidine synthase